jgi:hypothetical protein
MTKEKVPFPNTPLTKEEREERKRLMRIEIKNAPIRWEFRRDRRKGDK